MKNFTYARAGDTASAIDFVEHTENAKYLGGGTNLVDLMREDIEGPDAVVDVTGFSTGIEVTESGGLLIGAGVRNTAVASNQLVRARFPLLSEAILNGASAQIRNMATVAGNLMQRTRCYYFYDTATRCNKRQPGSGCDAIHGHNRIHAILGTSSECIATHPSDMCVALAALDAVVHVEGRDGRRQIPMTDFHRLPGDTPDVDTELRQGELITAVEIPSIPFISKSSYRKVRDRASYAFALVSVAAILHVENGIIHNVRLAMGGVAHKPWRARAAEAALQGLAPTRENFSNAAQVELQAAVGFEHNRFKIGLAERVIASVLSELAGAGAAA